MTNETTPMGDWIEHDPSRGQPVEDDVETAIMLVDGFINQFTHPAKVWDWDGAGSHSIAKFQAAADHDIYKVIAENAKHADDSGYVPLQYLRQDNRKGPPDDWDSSGPVLFMGEGLSEPNRELKKTAWLTRNSNWTIIAYTPLRAESTTPNASIPAPDKAETGQQVNTLEQAKAVIESAGGKVEMPEPVDSVTKLAREICAEKWPGIRHLYMSGGADKGVRMDAVKTAIRRTEARYVPLVRTVREVGPWLEYRDPHVRGLLEKAADGLNGGE